MSREERRSENGYSYTEDGKVYIVRCHECGRENYALNVNTGVCTWCGYDENLQALAEIK